jgi:hypothetical protein
MASSGTCADACMPISKRIKGKCFFMFTFLSVIALVLG